MAECGFAECEVSPRTSSRAPLATLPGKLYANGASRLRKPRSKQLAGSSTLRDRHGNVPLLWRESRYRALTAANFDAVDYIKKHHERIYVLHLKDRKRDPGANMPWGEGDTPIKPVLQLPKKEKYPMRPYVECEQRGAADSVTAAKTCIQFCRHALA
jgi:hypothetical protein